MATWGQYHVPPTFSQADARLESEEIESNRAFERAQELKLHGWKKEDIMNQMAANAAFFSGATNRKLSRANDEFLYGQQKADREAKQRQSQLYRNQFLIGLGVRM